MDEWLFRTPKDEGTKGLDLFEPAHARADDPETAKEAAASLNEEAITQRMMQALAAIHELGGEAIAEKIVERSGIPIQTLSPRLRPLERLGYVREAGKTRASTGRQQIVWRLTDLGRAVFEE